jgi:type II secretory pathway pseudopilin PulG
VDILIVISIMGILISIAIPVLNIARDKGTDSSVKTSLYSLKAEGGIHYTDNGSYLGICTLNQKFPDVMTTAQEAVSGVVTVGGWGDGECTDSDGDWAAWVNLKYSTTSAFCVDSGGASKDIPAQDSSNVDLLVCP